MKKLVLLSLFAVTLSSCSAIKLKEFDRGPASSDQFDKDGATCEMEAKKHKAEAGWGTWNTEGNYNDMLETCMRSKGYRLK